MTLTTLLQWWNFIFALPLVLGLLLGLIVVATGVAGGDGHGDSHGGDGHTGDGHADSHADESPIFRVFNFFGIGQGVPLLVMLPILFVIWGVVGLLFNQLLAMPQLFVVTLVITVLTTAYAGQGLSKLMARVFKDTTQAVDSESLVGMMGSVVYAVTPTGGVVFTCGIKVATFTVWCAGVSREKPSSQTKKFWS